MFWVMMNDHPEYNDKVALMQGLGPVARVDHMHSVIRIFAPFANDVEVCEPAAGGEYLLCVVDNFFIFGCVNLGVIFLRNTCNYVTKLRTTRSVGTYMK